MASAAHVSPHLSHLNIPWQAWLEMELQDRDFLLEQLKDAREAEIEAAKRPYTKR